MAVGERVLLPAVRATDDDTLIVADGFSCREQISQGTGRRTLHLAEVLQLALRQSRGEADDDRNLERVRKQAPWRLALPAVMVAMLAAIVLRKLRRRG